MLSKFKRLYVPERQITGLDWVLAAHGRLACNAFESRNHFHQLYGVGVSEIENLKRPA